MDAERARGILRQERATTSAEDASNGVALDVDSGGEEVLPVEEAEEEHDTASPRRSRRKTRNATPRYVEHVVPIALCFAHVVCT